MKIQPIKNGLWREVNPTPGLPAFNPDGTMYYGSGIVEAELGWQVFDEKYRNWVNCIVHSGEFYRQKGFETRQVYIVLSPVDPKKESDEKLTETQTAKIKETIDLLEFHNGAFGETKYTIKAIEILKELI